MRLGLEEAKRMYGRRNEDDREAQPFWRSYFDELEKIEREREKIKR